MSTTRRTPASSAAPSVTAVPSTLTDRIASRVDLDRQRRRGMDEHVGAADEATCVGGEPHVAVELLDPPVELGIVERREIEDAHLVPVADQASGEVQAEEARAAGDRDEHGAER